MSSEQSTSEIRTNRPLASLRTIDADVHRMRQRQQLLQQERVKLRQQVRALARSLEKTKLELGELARNLVAAQEEERRRILVKSTPSRRQVQLACHTQNGTARAFAGICSDLPSEEWKKGRLPLDSRRGIIPDGAIGFWSIEC